MSKVRFGLSNYDLKIQNEKIIRQRSFLTSNFFTTSTGQVKSLFDVNYSANHSVRYYAQLANKVNTMSSIAYQLDLMPVFITCTLDGYFRDFQRGDYSRYDALDDKVRDALFHSIPNNETYGFIRDKIDRREVFTVKDCYNVLNFQTKRFYGRKVFSHIRKSGQYYMYIRSVEPHEDGTPHFHKLLWIPQQYLNDVLEAFKASYPAPRNSERRVDRNRFGVSKIYDDGQTEGFQWDIRKPAGYIMKYITKSFRNVQKNKPLGYIQAWYSKHRITRCVTSHSLIPQWIYQKIAPFEQDWYYLTDMLHNSDKHAEWFSKEDYFLFLDDSGRTLMYDQGRLTLSYGDKILKEFGNKRQIKHNRYPAIPKKWFDKKMISPSIELHDGIPIVYHGFHPSSMSSPSLYSLYNRLSYKGDKLEQHRKVNLHNILISRGVFDGVPLSLIELSQFD